MSHQKLFRHESVTSVFLPIERIDNVFLPFFPPTRKWQIVNTIVNGNSKVTPKSATLYGVITGIDQLFTFLMVNAACSASDRFGRKPFL